MCKGSSEPTDGDTVHLSGGFNDCQNATDPTCANTNSQPYTLMMELDFQSAFVKCVPSCGMSIGFWIVLQEMLGVQRYLVSPCLFDQDTSQDLTLLKNVAVRPLISTIEPLSTQNT